MNLTPENDGIEFINVYSQARTQLGRDLSNFSFHPINHKSYGYFASIEAAWYYYSSGGVFDSLRSLHGSEAKYKGRKLMQKNKTPIEQRFGGKFKYIITECIKEKFRTHPDLLLALISSNLKLVHFYSYPNNVVIEKNEHQWVLDVIEDIRKVSQEWYLKKFGSLPNIDLKFIE